MTDHCPTCDSPNPKLHPAIQHEGEVSVCPDPWHPPVIDKLRNRKVFRGPTLDVAVKAAMRDE